MKRAILSLWLLLAAGCYWVVDEDQSFSLHNRSSLSLIDVRMQPMDAVGWGPNLLAGDWLEPGDTLVVDEMACDAFDLRVVVHGGASCVYHNLWMCMADLHWDFDDDMMIDCEWD
jgi:hypothetical protein